jgi:hypothetical protein
MSNVTSTSETNRSSNVDNDQDKDRAKELEERGLKDLQALTGGKLGNTTTDKEKAANKEVIADFQKSLGLPPSGTFTKATLIALENPANAAALRYAAHKVDPSIAELAANEPSLGHKVLEGAKEIAPYVVSPLGAVVAKAAVEPIKGAVQNLSKKIDALESPDEMTLEVGGFFADGAAAQAKGSMKITACPGRGYDVEIGLSADVGVMVGKEAHGAEGKASAMAGLGGKFTVHADSKEEALRLGVIAAKLNSAATAPFVSAEDMAFFRNHIKSTTITSTLAAQCSGELNGTLGAEFGAGLKKEDSLTIEWANGKPKAAVLTTSLEGSVDAKVKKDAEIGHNKLGGCPVLGAGAKAKISSELRFDLTGMSAADLKHPLDALKRAKAEGKMTHEFVLKAEGELAGGGKRGGAEIEVRFAAPDVAHAKAAFNALRHGNIEEAAQAIPGLKVHAKTYVDNVGEAAFGKLEGTAGAGVQIKGGVRHFTGPTYSYPNHHGAANGGHSSIADRRREQSSYV